MSDSSKKIVAAAGMYVGEGESGGCWTPFHLPIDAVTQTFAVLGRRGAGKTTTAVVLAEEMLTAGQHVLAIDPLDVWWGLRASLSGEASGGYHVIVFGGDHADMPLHADAGRIIADAVVEERIDAVLSLRHLSKGEMRRFVGDFCDRLYDRKGEERHRTPMHVFIDEADAFVPQRIFPGGERAYGAIDTIVRRGRSCGLGTTLISQRAAVISKDVLTQTEMLVSHQTTGPQDRKALEAWVDANDPEGQIETFMGSLAALPRGVAWFWSPSWLGVLRQVRVRQRRTFDSSATPKANELPMRPKALAEVDLTGLRKKIESLQQKPTEEPSGVRKGKKKSNGLDVLESVLGRPGTRVEDVAVSDPSGKLSITPITIVREVMVERVPLDVVSKVNMLRREMVFMKETVVAQIDARLAMVDDALKLVTADPKRTVTEKPAEASKADLAKKLGAPKVRQTVMVDRIEGDGVVSSSEMKLLIAVAMNGERGATPAEVRMRAGYTKGSFRNVIGPMMKKQYLRTDEGRKRLWVTERGRAHLPENFKPLPTGEKLRARVLAELPEGEAKVLAALCDVYPAGLTKEQIATAIGYTVGSTRNVIGLVKRQEFITRTGKEYRASDLLFGSKKKRARSAAEATT